jgi:hypothetical protein
MIGGHWQVIVGGIGGDDIRVNIYDRVLVIPLKNAICNLMVSITFDEEITLLGRQLKGLLGLLTIAAMVTL